MLSLFKEDFSDIFVKFYIVEICLISWYYSIPKTIDLYRLDKQVRVPFKQPEKIYKGVGL